MELFEAIRFENGEFDNLAYHEERMNRSRRTLFGLSDPVELKDKLQSFITGETGKSIEKDSLNKCRVVYSKAVASITCAAYSLPEIKSLRMVVDNTIEYGYKYSDRSMLERLFQYRGSCDDILIVKNGKVTDTSYANILFFDGQNWWTPQSPLLPGTRRASLLDRKSVYTADIKIEDLQRFKKARLINAMIRFENQLDIDMRNILP